jgi:hypothetical protein
MTIPRQRSTRSTVYVCTEGCAKSDPALVAVMETLEPVADVREIACVGICDGPVVGVRAHRRVIWFAAIKLPAQRSALAEFVVAPTGAVPAALVERVTPRPTKTARDQ